MMKKESRFLDYKRDFHRKKSIFGRLNLVPELFQNI